MYKYLAELFGTFGLTLVVMIMVSGATSHLTPMVATLTLGLFVYTIGRISGTHINPAVTLGALAICKINAKDAIGYIASQFIGAGAALLVFGALGLSLPTLEVSEQIGVGLAEMVGMVFFTFGIASVMYGKAPEALSGVVVGGSLFLGIMFASHASLGILNPAVAVGLGAFNSMYILGPVLGAMFGMWFYRLLSESK